MSQNTFFLNELNNIKNELNSVKEQIDRANNEIEKLKNNNINSNLRIGILELDLKKIKICDDVPVTMATVSSIYKSIIDIFAHLFQIDINTNYYNKLEKILFSLQSFEKNDKVNEFMEFFNDVYSYLRRGNSLTHNINENIEPLELVLTIIEKEKKKSYNYVKKILNNLSINYPLKCVFNNFYSLKDQSRLIQNIKFDLNELKRELN